MIVYIAFRKYNKILFWKQKYKPFAKPISKTLLHSFTNFISKTDLIQFGGLREDAEENFAISAGVAEALAKFFTSTQPQTYTHNVFEINKSK